MEGINLYTAIAQMRHITATGGSFSFTHATYNRDRMSSDGIRHVANARLRPAASAKEVREADHKLFYFDIDEAQPRVCWQPLIMFFNGKKIKLK